MIRGMCVRSVVHIKLYQAPRHVAFNRMQVNVWYKLGAEVHRSDVITCRLFVLLLASPFMKITCSTSMSVRRHSKCFADVAQHPDHPHSVTIVLETRDRQGNGRKNQSRDLHARHSESARPKRTKQLCCREAESVNLTILPEACRARQTQLMQANLPSKRQSSAKAQTSVLVTSSGECLRSRNQRSG